MWFTIGASGSAIHSQIIMELDMSIESVPLAYEELRVRCWKLCFTDNALLARLVRMGKQVCLVKHYQFAEAGFGGWAD